VATHVRMSVAPGFRHDMEQLAEDLTHRLGRAIAVDAIRNAPVDTTLLSRSIRYYPSARRVIADTEYAAAVESGSGPHLIHNAWGREGVTVEHPGGPAQPYLRPAAYKRRASL